MQIGIGLRLQANSGGWGAYAAGGFTPAVVADFVNAKYRKSTGGTTFAGLLTHSRAGNATMVDSSGLLKWAPHNLALNSEDFTAGTWVRAAVTASANATIAPDGSLTADLITEDTSTGVHRVFDSAGVTVVSGVNATRGVYVKANGRTRVQLTDNTTTTRTIFDLTTGTTVSGPGTITAAANGFWFISHQSISATTTERLVLYLDNGSTDSYTGDGVSGVYVWGAHVYRSDLGGMVNNPDTGSSYVPTTSAAVYLARRNHYVSGVNKGLLLESAAATNLLLQSAALSTQSVTVTAAAHTLAFTGTGTVTLTGVSTAGPLVGTGAADRVSLTFTPTAGSLTLTVSGSVTLAQLELGSVPTSYIPTTSATVTRAAETLTIAAANMAYSATAMSFAIEGEMNYADTDTAIEAEFFTWFGSSTSYIRTHLKTTTARTGSPLFGQRDTTAGSFSVEGSNTSYSPGLNVPFNLASRNTPATMNGAHGGTLLTASATGSPFPSLSAITLQLATIFNGTISSFRQFNVDIGDSGITEAST